MQRGNRREFLGGVAGAAIAGQAIASAGRERAERLPIALIGCGGMGMNHLKLLAGRDDVHVAYVCDPDESRLAEGAKAASSHGPALVKDMRKVFDDPAIAAVWIAAPDHWHGPATLLALAAGKHVYVEKPAAHNVREGRLMVRAAREANRIVQVGTQSRSTPYIRKAMELLAGGAIGEVLVAKAWNSQRRGSIGHAQPSDPPKGLDFDLWLGPAPERKYQSNLLPGVWRFWRDFGTGDIGNDGVHELDIARWGLGVTGHPNTVAALGRKLAVDDDQQFPDTMYCVYEYGPGEAKGKARQLVYEQRDWSPYVQEGHENGNAFYGTEGMMILGKGKGYQLFGPKNKLIESESGAPDVAAHHQDFIDRIRKARAGGDPGRPNGDIEEGHRSATLAHLGNIACTLGRTLRFNPETEHIADDHDADALVRRAYRPGHWAMPKGV